MAPPRLGRRLDCARLPPDASPGLRALEGKSGALAVALADYAGFEPVQRLVAAAVWRTSRRSSWPHRSRDCTRSTATRDARTRYALVGRCDDEASSWISATSSGASRTFRAAMGQLERFVDDKVLVSRRERASISDKLAQRTRRTPWSGPRLATGWKPSSCASPGETRRSTPDHALDSREDGR